MSKNQLHGKTFEGLILSQLGCSENIKSNSIFDIPFIDGLQAAGSIKMSQASKKNIEDTTVYLSDATRVWCWKNILSGLMSSNSDPMLQIFLGVYEQQGGNKIIHTIYEIELVLNLTTVNKIYGSLTVGDIQAFHLCISKEFHEDSIRASEWAKVHKERLRYVGGSIQLNYKIDSKSQRRLQCSIKLKDLIDASNKYVIYQESFMGMQFPIIINSSVRERNLKILSI